MYVTRTYSGLYKRAIKTLRARMKERGLDLFLVGDEIFWKVKEGRSIEEDSSEPIERRVQLFDAITAYNLYEGEFLHHAGHEGLDAFFEESTDLYRRYEDAAGSDTIIFPEVMPGYNDRVLRPRIDHYVIPRRTRPDAATGSTLEAMLERLAKPFLDSRLPVVLVTSFNEWNEGTQVEPTVLAEPTRHEDRGRRFTQG